MLSSCEQQEGDRCETTSDCADNLICCIPTGEQEGTCQYEENCQIQKKLYSSDFSNIDNSCNK